MARLAVICKTVLKKTQKKCDTAVPSLTSFLTCSMMGRLGQMRSHHLTLIRDTQELWNFLAAQLELHSGYHIKNLQTTDDAITIVRKYKSVLFEDVTFYKSQLGSDTSVTAKSMLSSLSRLNTSLTRLFHKTLYELKRIKGIKNFLPLQLSNETKMQLRLLNTNVAAMVQKLSSQINQQTISKKLGREIQEEIHRLQNPPSCLFARKLLCGVCRDLANCGFGCTLYHIGLCMVTAYLSNRTMILDCSGWKYSSRGWEAAFQPISNCTLEHIKSGFFSSIPEFQTEAQLSDVFNPLTPETIRMRMPVSSKIGAYIFPPAVPRDILNKILQFNDDPSSWFWGQFKLWAMRLKDDVARDIKEHMNTHNITSPVVGLHIRRSDKNSEASYHFLDEYMVHVAEWYDAYETMHSNVQRKVYLATDEPAIIEEATTRYASYEFIYDKTIVSSAALSSRYNEESLLGTLKDIYSLLRCDNVVCTFSSTMCRLMYELAQAEYGGSHMFKSLDNTYFVHEARPLFGFVRHNYNASRQNEVYVNRGQAVIILENHWDGYVNIQNLNRTMTGLVPAFTIERLFDVYNYSSKVKR